MYDGRSSKIANVRGHMKNQKMGYPVLFDCGGRMWKELGLRGYPMAFLIGSDGKVFWEGILGKSAHPMVQTMIEKRLKP